MGNVELKNYIELAEEFYAVLTEWCNSQTESDLYINSGKVDTLQLKVNLVPSLNDVVFGLRQDNHIAKATRLEDAIANARKAVDDYDNGNIDGDKLIERVLRITGELTAPCRPAAPKRSAETRQDITPAEEQEEKAKEITSINIQDSNVILGDVQAENLQIGDDATIHKKEKAENPPEKVQSTALGKFAWIRGLLWKLYDATVKSALEWLWTKIFPG